MVKNVGEEVESLVKKPEGVIIAQLGIALQYEYAPWGVRYKAPYKKMGRELWRSVKYELHGLLCDRKAEKPKEWTLEFLSGDFRNLAVAVVTLLVASLNVPLSIAVPAAALILKKGVGSFCATKHPKPKKSVRQILSDQKQRMKGI